MLSRLTIRATSNLIKRNLSFCQTRVTTDLCYSHIRSLDKYMNFLKMHKIERSFVIHRIESEIGLFTRNNPFYSENILLMKEFTRLYKIKMTYKVNFYNETMDLIKYTFEQPDKVYKNYFL